MPHPLAEVADAPQRVPRLDQPVDVLVESDAVVVRIHDVIGLEPGHTGTGDLGAEGGDRLGDESHRQSVEVGTLPVALLIGPVER